MLGRWERISKWDEDMREERELAKFLDAHFYQKLLEEGGSQSFRRVSDVELQKAGVDVIGSAAGRMAFIDEKAQLYYVNRPCRLLRSSCPSGPTEGSAEAGTERNAWGHHGPRRFKDGGK